MIIINTITLNFVVVENVDYLITPCSTGLVLTGLSGATIATIPAATILAGKALLLKTLLVKKGN